MKKKRKSLATVKNGVIFYLSLSLILTILKMTRVIHWHWIFVFAPLWAPITLVFGFILMMVFIIWMYEILAKWLEIYGLSK